MKKNHVFGTFLELEAATVIYRFNAHVLMDVGARTEWKFANWPIDIVDDSLPHFYFAFRNMNHYDVLLRIGGLEPQNSINDTVTLIDTHCQPSALSQTLTAEPDSSDEGMHESEEEEDDESDESLRESESESEILLNALLFLLA